VRELAVTEGARCEANEGGITDRQLPHPPSSSRGRDRWTMHSRTCWAWELPWWVSIQTHRALVFWTQSTHHPSPSPTHAPQMGMALLADALF